jgi:hypothetical protein
MVGRVAASAIASASRSSFFLHVGPHVFRRHQPHLEAVVAQQATKVMGAPASLHRDHLRPQLRHDLADILSAHPPPHHDLSRAIKASKAANILAQVDPNNRDLHWLSPFLLSYWQLKAAGWRGGPFHNLGNFMRTLAMLRTAERGR